MFYNSLALFVDEGRAWLYQALSDHLLESYVRCYADNVKLVKSFYMQDALVLDYQVIVTKQSEFLSCWYYRVCCEASKISHCNPTSVCIANSV